MAILKSVQGNFEERARGIIEALGGEANIAELDEYCMTRLRLTIKDLNQVNEAGLSALGSKANMRVGKNGLQVVLGHDSDQIGKIMLQLLK